MQTALRLMPYDGTSVGFHRSCSKNGPRSATGTPTVNAPLTPTISFTSTITAKRRRHRMDCRYVNAQGQRSGLGVAAAMPGPAHQRFVFGTRQAIRSEPVNAISMSRKL